MCFICSNPLSNGQTVTVERGMQTLRDASKQRNDGKIEYLCDVTSIKIHIDCRRNYVRKSSIAIFVSKRERENDGPSMSSSSSPPHTRLRLSEQSSFDFEKLCFFVMTRPMKKKKKKGEKKRRRISLVSTHAFKDSIIATADKLGGDFAKTVKNRIIFEDLLAAEARYHLQCYLNFLRSRKPGNVGRPSY